MTGSRNVDRDDRVAATGSTDREKHLISDREEGGYHELLIAIGVQVDRTERLTANIWTVGQRKRAPEVGAPVSRVIDGDEPVLAARIRRAATCLIHQIPRPC